MESLQLLSNISCHSLKENVLFITGQFELLVHLTVESQPHWIVTTISNLDQQTCELHQTKKKKKKKEEDMISDFPVFLKTISISCMLHT